MNELRDWLKDDDPVANEPPLSDADVQRMRRAILAHDTPRESSVADWVRGSWAAATVVIALAIAVGTSRWLRPTADAGLQPTGPVPAAVSEAVNRRQVQLVAPGGTRVIWILNADFEIKE